jgi:hypothetical protein
MVRRAGSTGNDSARRNAKAGQSRPTELVGESLWLRPKTVETHVRHILRKLNLRATLTTADGCSPSLPNCETTV